MYTFIENLDKETYENYVSNHQQVHFMHSWYWGEVQKNKSFKPYYVAMKKDDEIVATALLLEKKVLKNYGYMYIPRGFVLDYNDNQVVKAFTTYIKTFVSKKKNFFYRIDPPVKLQCIDENGNRTEGADNHQLVEYLKSLGYTHLGFNKDFEGSQPRYTFRLDANREMNEVFSGYHATTRKVLNKGNQYELDIFKGDVSNIKDFYVTMESTGNDKNIIQSSMAYYKQFYEILNKKNMSDLYVVKVNIEHLTNMYDQLISEYNTKIEQTTKKNVINDLKNKVTKLHKELNEVKAIEEKELVLSSIITAKYNGYVWTVHGGNNSKLKYLNANYLIYNQIIEDATNDGAAVIDFFGTTGNPVKENSLYGIHLFKKRLGGEYTEFIGQFDYPTNKLLYRAYNWYINRKRK